VVACDLGNLQSGTIQRLIANFSDEAIATCYHHTAGFPKTLCAIDTPSALPILQTAFAQQQYCPVKILQTVDCVLIDPMSDRKIANINTPDDWQGNTV
jgi:molybdopterin-guanine dinucleotide biosynthesis protein A